MKCKEIKIKIISSKIKETYTTDNELLFFYSNNANVFCCCFSKHASAYPAYQPQKKNKKKKKHLKYACDQLLRVNSRPLIERLPTFACTRSHHALRIALQRNFSIISFFCRVLYTLQRLFALADAPTRHCGLKSLILSVQLNYFHFYIYSIVEKYTCWSLAGWLMSVTKRPLKLKQLEETENR